MTEPDGGSDFLGAMRTRAVRDGDDYVLNGAKMWITNANVADVAIVYAKTDPAAGHRGVSAFVVPTSTPGFEAVRVPCRGLGKLMPTTAVSLTDVRVPADALLGDRGAGLRRRDERDGLRPADRGRPLGGAGAGVPGRRARVRRRAHRVRREDRQLPDGQEAARRHDRRGGGRARAGRRRPRNGTTPATSRPGSARSPSTTPARCATAPPRPPPRSSAERRSWTSCPSAST